MTTAPVFDVCYQTREDKCPVRWALTTTDEAKARAYCAALSGPLAAAIHYAITCDDGRTLHDTRRDGLL
jgi:hypothetical protein